MPICWISSLEVYDFFIQLFKKFGNHLTSLSFFADYSTISFLSGIQKCCPNLTHLELAFKKYSPYRLQTMIFLNSYIDNQLFKQLNNLKSLTIDNYIIAHEFIPYTSVEAQYSDTTILESLNNGIEEISLTASTPRSLMPSENFATVSFCVLFNN